MTDTNKALEAFDWLIEYNVKNHNYRIKNNQKYADLTRFVRAALSPNAVVIPRDEFESIKTLITHIRYRQKFDAAGKACRAECDEILAILSQYGEQK